MFGYEYYGSRKQIKSNNCLCYPFMASVAAITAVAEVGYLVAKEVSFQALSLTITNISNLMLTFSLNQSSHVKNTYKQLELKVPVLKLKIVESMLNDFKKVRGRIETIDTILANLQTTADAIHLEVSLIDSAVREYESYYFYKWRTYLFNVDQNMGRIEARTKQLDETLKLMTDLFPSCCVLALQSDWLPDRDAEINNEYKTKLKVQTNHFALVPFTKS